MGCNEVILKPLIGDDLHRTIKSYLGDSKPFQLFRPSLILLGASTGGTETLVRLLKNLPASCPPVMVVQHITHGFAKDFAHRLADVSGLTLGRMESDESLQDNHLYISLGNYHIGVQGKAKNLRLFKNEGPEVSGHRPSVDFLFESASKCQTPCFAALLTGMDATEQRDYSHLNKLGHVRQPKTKKPRWFLECLKRLLNSTPLDLL